MSDLLRWLGLAAIAFGLVWFMTGCTYVTVTDARLGDVTLCAPGVQ